MKLKSISITGLRGIPGTFNLDLAGKSLCLTGANGHGKSTFVDGIEFWSTGNIERFKGSKMGLDAAINLDAESTAVECQIDGMSRMSRSLDGKNSGDLIFVGPEKGVIPTEHVPILRHQTMSEFMLATAGDRKRSVLNLLGLTDVLAFRDTLTTARNRLKKAAKSSMEDSISANSRLEALCGGDDLLDMARTLVATARVDVEFVDIEQFASVNLSVDGSQGPTLDGLIVRLQAAATGLNFEAIPAWNKATQVSDARHAGDLHSLVTAGQRVLHDWTEQDCPLCRSDIDPRILSDSLESREEELRRTSSEIVSAKERLERHGRAISDVSTALSRLRTHPQLSDAESAGQLVDAEADAERSLTEITTALTEFSEIPDHRQVDVPAIARVCEAEITDEASPRAAKDRLIELQKAAHVYLRAQEVEAETKATFATIEELYQHSEATTKSLIESEIGRLSKLVAEYFGRLTRSPIYSDVKLTYSDAYQGGIDFELVFDQREKVSPPQRVVSESQLNSLGLAFFLAHHQLDDGQWQTLILDDVVNSFDADHRMGIAKLLADEFSNWQVLFFTHDLMFGDLNHQFASGWRHQEIIAWSPAAGPTLSDGQPLIRLQARLDNGESASDLGGLARRALEGRLATLLDRLAFEITFKRQAFYTAHDYLVALARGLNQYLPNSDAVGLIGRIKASSFVVNLGSHDKPQSPDLSRSDLAELVVDLNMLQEALTCPDCGTPVWENRKRDGSLQCNCESLAIHRS